MQRAKVCRTMPSGFRAVAFTGQTLMHGGLSQCTQGSGVGRMLSRGYSPSICGSTLSQEMMRPRAASSGGTQGTLFSVWQATTQAWQAVHFAKSMTMPQRGIVESLLRAINLHICAAGLRQSGQRVVLLLDDLQRVRAPARPGAARGTAVPQRQVHHPGPCALVEARACLYPAAA